jgi:glycosyltransferase involved in cell wall biosynthesis
MTVVLDVVLPTFKRPELLSQTLDSLAMATLPVGLQVTVWIVDNNSNDETPEVVARYRQKFPMAIQYLLEKQPGSSAAMNAGIRAGSGDVIGLINDDERIDGSWFKVIYRLCTECDQYSFFGGPYLPAWGGRKPDWFISKYGSVIGAVSAGDEPREYGADLVLMAGNAVIKRCALNEVGLFNTRLGRTGNGLLSCEDEELYGRLLEAGHKGLYCPELKIHHYVPPERLTRAYYRKWFWGHGISKGLLSRTRPSGVVEVFGIPRWQIRHAIIGLVLAARGQMGFAPPDVSFDGELRLWDLAGFMKGRFLGK